VLACVLAEKLHKTVLDLEWSALSSLQPNLAQPDVQKIMIEDVMRCLKQTKTRGLCHGDLDLHARRLKSNAPERYSAGSRKLLLFEIITIGWVRLIQALIIGDTATLK
jgi:hypothetical protein